MQYDYYLYSNIFYTCVTVTLIQFILFWIISVKLTNASIVDLIWGTTYAINVSISLLLSIIFNYKKLINLNSKEVILIFLFTTSIAAHGIRLTVYLCKRNIGQGEDKRYKAFRKKFGENYYWIVSLFQVFLLQWCISCIICSPFRFSIFYIIDKNTQISDIQYFLAYIGILIAIISTILQHFADEQLYKFLNDKNRDEKILKKGLWKYSRHPNYFAEILFHWSIYFICLSLGDIYRIYPAIIMNILLIYVSGVNLTEKLMKRNNNYSEEYREYIESTNALIPKLY